MYKRKFFWLCQIYRFCSCTGIDPKAAVKGDCLQSFCKVRHWACRSAVYREQLPSVINCRGPDIGSPSKHEIQLCLANRDTWQPLWPSTSDHKVEVKRPSQRGVIWALTRSENLSGGLGGPDLGSDDWCDGSVSMCHCNAQINTCSFSGAHSPKTSLAVSAVFLGQRTWKCWPLLIRETNWRGCLHTGLTWGPCSLSSALKKRRQFTPSVSFTKLLPLYCC